MKWAMTAARAYALTAAISLLAAILLLKLWGADLRVPFDYGGDALSFSIVVKSVVDNGWYLHTPQVGAPFGLDMHDFPFADSLHLLVIKGMSLFSGDWALLFNLYFLLGFPLIAMAAMAVFRYHRLPFGISLVVSVLYAFLPSRLLKGENHIFMDVFFQVPLAILVVLWVCEERPPLLRDRAGRWPGLELRNRRSIAALVICVVTACTGLYYAFFTGFLLVAAGAWTSLRRRSPHHLIVGTLLAGVIGAGLAANGLPTMLYRAKHGLNEQVAVRKSFDAELYALKPVELVLPVDGHRLKPLANLKQRYQSGPPHLGEEGASLGIMGTLGLLALLSTLLLAPSRERPRSELFRTLAFLNVMMLILGIVGGLGSLFALLVSPQIRTYARVNVVIGFLALFALGLLLERLRGRRPRLADALTPLVLALGLLDQATLRAVRAYAALKTAYQSDAALVRRIEASVPAGAMIFQLPHVSFPEGMAVQGMGSYDTIRPYLHSHSLRWAQPAMRGRAGDAWLAAVSEQEPPRLLRTLTDAGFEGLLIDRQGYADGGVAIEDAFRRLLGGEPVVGTTGRLVFFDLGASKGAARANVGTAERERRQELALHPLFLSWGGGFSGMEALSGRSWRWCSAGGELTIENGSRFDRQVSVRMTAVAAKPPASLEIDGDLTSARFELGPQGAMVSLSLRVPPGRHTVRFRSDGQRADAPGDPRVLVWRAEAPVAEETSLGEDGRPVR
jgi:hypothetical protein